MIYIKGRFVPIFIPLLFVAGTIYKGFHEYRAGRRFIVKNYMNPEKVFYTPLAFYGGDTWDYILPALQLYKIGKPEFLIDGEYFLFCRRNPTTYLIFTLFWVFGKYMPVVFVFLVSLLFSVLLYIFYSILMELEFNKFLLIFSGIVYLPYWIERVSRIMMEGLVSIIALIIMIVYLNDIKKGAKLYISKYLLPLSVLSFIRGEFLIVLIFYLFFMLYYRYKNKDRITGFSIFAITLSIVLFIWNIHWVRTCGETSGIWEWGYRNIIKVKYNYSYNKIRQHEEKLNNKIIKNLSNKKIYDKSYKFFIIHHSFPYYNNGVNLKKSQIFDLILKNDNLRLYILYRILLRNPYLFIFAQPSGSFVSMIKARIRYFNIIYHIWGIVVIISIICIFIQIFVKKDKIGIFVLMTYFIIMIIYDAYYFAGGAHFSRFKSFYSFLEIMVVYLSFRNTKITNKSTLFNNLGKDTRIE